MVVPRLADVKLRAVKFQPGDRILVDVYQVLSINEINKLKKTVEKWAGGCVEVLIVNRNLFKIEVDHGDQTIICP
ncbi:hypothetical protein KAR91_77385 [Candidatus Pacearchaeota archaeon]|nr:hypothetical protein [Candidatus Pacearchaeota archaeon]